MWLTAGVLTEVGVPSARLLALRYAGGQGANTWVGAGWLTVVDSSDLSESITGWMPDEMVKYWVMGSGSKTGLIGRCVRNGPRSFCGECRVIPILEHCLVDV